MTGFHAAAALLGLLVVARNARRALAAVRPSADADERLRGLAPLIACLAGLAVAGVAVKALLAGLISTPGGTP